MLLLKAALREPQTEPEPETTNEDLSEHVKRTRYDEAGNAVTTAAEDAAVPVSRLWKAYYLQEEQETLRDMEFLRRLRTRFVSSGLAEKLGYEEKEILGPTIVD